MELVVLRFIIFITGHGNQLNKFNSVDFFLTHSLREMIKTQNFDFNSQRQLFEKTFKKIKDVAGEGGH